MYPEKYLFNAFIGLMIITIICLVTAFSLSAISEGWPWAFFRLAGVCTVAGAIFTPMGFDLFTKTNYALGRNIGRLGLILLAAASLIFSAFWLPLVFVNAIIGFIIIASAQLGGEGIWAKRTNWARTPFVFWLGIALVFGNLISRAFA